MANPRSCILIMSFFAAISAQSQSVKEFFRNSGIWADFSMPLSPTDFPEFKGRLVNINWSDIEPEPNLWDWTLFDYDITTHTADSMPVIFMVYTRMSAPDWLFSNGVPKVNETDEHSKYTGYSPYYLDENYNFYFKRMITEVRKHVETLEPKIRNKIIGVQACFGSTGDQIAYKGNVASQYEITDAQFDSLFKVYSLYYYNEYKDLVPRIKILHNPGTDNGEQHYWLIENCPGGWIKCPSMGKGFQLNMELDKLEWLYDLLNKPWSGSYIKSRSEIIGQQLDAGWWKKDEYKNMFAIMCYCVYWGMDWPNETPQILQDHKHDSALHFFNKYAGQKAPAVATNAMCALKDALDAADGIRFPESQYGEINRENKDRYTNIYEHFKAYGAKLEDKDVLTGREYEYLWYAKGTNDVGWRLLPGNYERYLKQIDANKTSAGYWNVDDENKDAMYGRFGRGFDLAEGKDALYFDLEDLFLRGAPLDGKYPVTIEVTYYDRSTGSWQLYYDAQSNENKPSVNVTCNNTKTWKKETIVLDDAYFGNRSKLGSDFYIKSTNGSDVIFSIVELSRPEQSANGFITSPLAPYDTICLNSTPDVKSFVLNAGYLDSTEDVQVGPLKGYTFSRSLNRPFRDSLIFNDFKMQVNSTIYVKINTSDEGVFNGNIPIKGGGVPSTYVFTKATVLNTSPDLNPNVTPISCYRGNDAAINLKPTSGIGPFTYLWTCSEYPWWRDSSKDISGLKDMNYTVTVSSFAGCSTTKTFSFTEPDILVTSVSQDSDIVCRGGSTTLQVTATGGTMPYTGTGTLTVTSGYNYYLVTDARGCTDQIGYWVPDGSIPEPRTPNIFGSPVVWENETGVEYSVFDIDGNKYFWTVPDDAVIKSGQGTSSITVNWGVTSGDVTVQARNQCGVSEIEHKNIYVKQSNFSQSGSSSMVTTTEVSNVTDRRTMLTPNPASDITNLQFYAENSFIYSVQFADINGKILLTRKGTAVPGTNIEKFDVHNFANGYYIITLINGKDKKQTFKFLKE